jgi:hypothetical protein
MPVSTTHDETSTSTIELISTVNIFPILTKKKIPAGIEISYYPSPKENVTFIGMDLDVKISERSNIYIRLF